MHEVSIVLTTRNIWQLRSFKTAVVRREGCYSTWDKKARKRYLKHEVNFQTKRENQKGRRITTNSTKCSNIEEKLESGIHITEILSKAADDDSKPCKLSESDDQTFCALGLFSDTLANTETISSDKLLNNNAVNNIVLIEGEVGESNGNTFDPKKREVTTLKLNTECHKCGKDMGVNYIAKKTHALQFHFTQDDDPEIAELLPVTIKACFPHSLSWSDYQISTELGANFGYS
uniref:C2H2-type domain-containing protein n=1 Tax=Loa loa TaxID=7209 RepID=A0A1I7VK82_LOALO